MNPILEQIPSTSDIDYQLEEAADALDAIRSMVEEYVPTDLSMVINAAKNISLPRKKELTEKIINQLDSIVEKIPDKDTLTAPVKKKLGEMKSHADLLTKINFNETADAINLIPPKYSSIKEWLGQSDFMKYYFDSNNSPDFIRNHIKFLCDNLPEIFADVITVDMEQINNIETGLAKLHRELWFEPLKSALSNLADINLNDLTKISDYQKQVDDTSALLSETVSRLKTDMENSRDELEYLEIGSDEEGLKELLSTICLGVDLKNPCVEYYILYKNHLDKKQLLPKQIEWACLETEKLLEKNSLSKALELTDTIIKQLTDNHEEAAAAGKKLLEDLSGIKSELEPLIKAIEIQSIVQAVTEGAGSLGQSVKEITPFVDETVKQIETLVSELVGELENLDIIYLKDLIDSLIKNATDALNDAVKALNDAEIDEAIDTSLKKISIKSIFNAANIDLAGLGKKLQGIDLSSLSSQLKLSVNKSIESVRAINIPDEIGDTLNAAYSSLFMEIAGLLQPFRDKFREISDKVDELNPEDLLKDNLIASYKELVTAIEKVDPQNSLGPLKKLHESLTEKTEELKSENLLKEIIELFDTGEELLENLSTPEIIEELNQIVLDEEFISRLEDSGEKIDEITGKLEKIETFFPGENTFQNVTKILEDIPADINGLKYKIISSLNISTLDFLKNKLKELPSEFGKPGGLQLIENISAGLRDVEFAAAVGELDQIWMVQKQRFEEFKAPDYTKLIKSVAALNPGNKFKPVVKQSEDLQTLLDQKKQDYNAKYDSACDLYKKFKNLPDDNLENLWPDKSYEDFTSYTKSLKKISAVFYKAYGSLQKFKSNLQALKDRVGEAVALLEKAEIHAEEESIDELILLFEKLEVENIRNEIDKQYKNALDEIDRVYPSELFNNLDTLFYKEILNGLENIDPEKTIVTPLIEDYEELQKLKEKVNIDVILKSTVTGINNLEKEFQTGAEQITLFYQKIPAEMIE